MRVYCGTSLVDANNLWLSCSISTLPQLARMAKPSKMTSDTEGFVLETTDTCEQLLKPFRERELRNLTTFMGAPEPLSSQL